MWTSIVDADCLSSMLINLNFLSTLLLYQSEQKGKDVTDQYSETPIISTWTQIRYDEVPFKYCRHRHWPKIVRPPQIWQQEHTVAFSISLAGCTWQLKSVKWTLLREPLARPTAGHIENSYWEQLISISPCNMQTEAPLHSRL